MEGFKTQEFKGKENIKNELKPIVHIPTDREGVQYPNEIGPWSMDLLDENGASIATLNFRLITENDGRRIFKLGVVSVAHDKRGSGILLDAYEKLISYAKEKGLDGVGSDNGVQGGALATWNKLAANGYDIIVNEQVKDQYETFCNAYKNKEKYTEQLAVPIDQSVFKIYFKKKDDR